jgi:sarcosine oxidase subunit beta
MTTSADAVIVGAGLNGAATAFFLQQQGLRHVVVVDAGLPGDGASGDAVGLLRTHYDNRPETMLAVRSLPWFREWHQRVGGSCGWLATGFFRFIGHDELWKLEANAAVQRELGDTAVVVSRDDLRSLAPGFEVDDVGGAVYEPDSGTADNDLAMRTLLARVCADGGELLPYTPVDRVLVEDGSVTGVRTARGSIAAPVVVVAAGIGSHAVGTRSGFELPCRAEPLAAAEVWTADGFVAPGSYMDPITDSWMAPRTGRRVIISVDRPAGPAAAAAGLVRVARRVPGMASAAVIRSWTRYDAFAPDGKPLIGAVSGIAGLYVNTAAAGKGHKVAPAAALGLSELITGGVATSVDLEPFGLDRFRSPSGPWSDTEYRQRTIG